MHTYTHCALLEMHTYTHCEILEIHTYTPCALPEIHTIYESDRLYFSNSHVLQKYVVYLPLHVYHLYKLVYIYSHIEVHCDSIEITISTSRFANVRSPITQI